MCLFGLLSAPTRLALIILPLLADPFCPTHHFLPPPAIASHFPVYMAPSSRVAASPPKDKDKDGSAELSDAALRKKKNADAQAAFRARRANYISTLEETG